MRCPPALEGKSCAFPDPRLDSQRSNTRRVGTERVPMKQLSRLLFGAFCLSTLAASAATAPLAPTDEPAIAILLVAGDIAKCDPRAGRDEATSDLVVAEIAHAEAANLPVRVLAPGDLAYDHGTAAEFKCFDQSWGRFKNKILPVPGNHEYETAHGAPYFDYFKDNPLVHQNGPGAGYYSLDFPQTGGSWHIVAINAYAGIDPGSKQLDWLDRDLRSTSAPCILAFSHPFRFSSGHWGHDRSRQPGAPIKPLPTVKAAYASLAAADASLFLAGHDHDFEQFGPQDEEGRAGRGPRAFVVGTGGGPLYNQVGYRTRATNSEAYQQVSHGVLKLTLYTKSFTWDFLPVAGDRDMTLSPNSASCRRS